MYQTIVLSPTFLKFLEKGDPIRREARSLLDQLETETIVLDTNGALRKEYAAVIEQSPKAEQLKWIFASLMSVVKLRSLQKNLTPRNVSDFENLENEIVLAAETGWRIIVAEAFSPLIKSDLLRKDIEVTNISDYLHPPQVSRIRTTESYVLNTGDTFNFRQWVCKYVLDAQSIEIADGYICTKHALADLKHILQKISPNIPIQIRTLSDSARDYSRNQLATNTDTLIVENELNKLKKAYSNLKWNIHDNKSELHDRWIKTDRFRIGLGRGLGFVNTKTNKVIGQTTITVSLEG